MKLENEIQQMILIEASKHNIKLYRNNSGAFKNPAGQFVRFGLGNISEAFNKDLKSSDEIGITPVLITADMVGTTLGVFTAIEVKREGWQYSATDREKAQLNFINAIRGRGGFAGFSDSIDSFKQIVGI
jgi:hypothetical protein